MNALDDIAIKQIRIEHGRLIDSYRQDIEAMKRRHAARGKLRSGESIKVTIDYSKNLFRQFRDLSIAKVKVVIEDSIVFPEPAIEKLKTSIAKMSLEMHEITYATMRDICGLLGKPELGERYMLEIENERQQILSEIDLHIASGVIAKRNRGIKGIAKSLFGWASKIFGSPAS